MLTCINSLNAHCCPIVLELWKLFEASVLINLSSMSAATPLGVITVPGDSDLETCRLLIERLHDNLEQVQHLSDYV